MSSKLLKDFDTLLTEVGLFRKVITNENSLFRAVSEAVYFTQSLHEKVKTKCLEHLKLNVSEYQNFTGECLQERITYLQQNKANAGHLEMLAMSEIYKMEFVFLSAPSLNTFSVSKNKFEKKIILCEIGDHYDLVYTKDHMQSSAVCQSIVYDILYRGVFGLKSELEEAVLFLELQKLPKESNISNCSLSDVITLFGRDKVDTLQRLCGRSSPPVPYRIAKALHPGLYRNVELDIVQEEKRETRLLNQGITKGLSPGDKCQVVLDDREERPYNGHLQAIDELQGTVVVFIEELGAKQTVSIKCIRPIPLPVPNSSEVSPLPVAHIDVLPYLKKNRRRKQHLPIPPVIEEVSSVPLASTPHRTRRNSSCSSTTNVISGDVNSSINSVKSTSSAGSQNNPDVPGPQRVPDFYGEPCQLVPTAAPLAAAQVIPPQPSFIPANFPYTAYPGPAYVGPCIGQSPALDSHFGVVPDPSAKYTSANLYCAGTQGETGQFVTAFDPNQPYCMMSAGHSPSQMYWMPVMAVPYPPNMGQVGMGWSPPQDPYGRDMPLSGVEYYRMSTQGNPEMGPMAPGAVMVDSYGNYTSVGPMMCGDAYINTGYGCVAPGYGDVTMTPGVSGGESDKIVSKTVQSDKCGRAGLFNTSALRPSDLRPSDLSGGRSYLSDKVVGCDKISATVEDKSKLENSCVKESVGQAEEGGKEGKAKEDEEDNDSEGMDVGSDGDSGCPSECADLSPVSGPDSFSSSELVHSDGGETASVTEQSTGESSKPKGKRRYYMYGNHKLVKPIKEIPLRFQILLAETSAAKARCEGQPIYMQHQPQPQPMYDIVYYHTNDDSQVTLNANASCFVPNPDGGGVDASANPYLPECYPAYCPVSGYPGAGATNTPSNSHAMPPAHVFVPPLPPGSIPSHSPGSQNCQTIIVYSSQTTNPATPSQPPPSQHVHTISMPPPFPPPSSLPPPPIDISSNNSPSVSNQAGRSLQVNHGQTKTTSTYVEQHIKTYNQPHPPNKSLPIPLNIPPPNIHPSSSNHSAPPVSMSPSLTYTMAPNYSGPTYMTMQPKVGFPPQGSPVQPLPTTPTSQPPAPSYPVPPGNQYMYVYTSPPAGQPATQPHVVYMVSPTYPSSQSFQQQGVLVPPTCPVPVQ